MHSKVVAIILIIIGSFIAIYAKAGEEQNIYVLIVGIVVLMLGLYRLSQGIPSKDPDNTLSDNHENEP